MLFLWWLPAMYLILLLSGPPEPAPAVPPATQMLADLEKATATEGTLAKWMKETLDPEGTYGDPKTPPPQAPEGRSQILTITWMALLLATFLLQALVHKAPVLAFRIAAVCVLPGLIYLLSVDLDGDQRGQQRAIGVCIAAMAVSFVGARAAKARVEMEAHFSRADLVLMRHRQGSLPKARAHS